MRIVVIDIDQLARDAAHGQFCQEVEDQLPFREVYEQVDETEQWYMKAEYASILETMEQTWRNRLEKYILQEYTEPEPELHIHKLSDDDTGPQEAGART